MVSTRWFVEKIVKLGTREAGRSQLTSFKMAGRVFLLVCFVFSRPLEAFERIHI